MEKEDKRMTQLALLLLLSQWHTAKTCCWGTLQNYKVIRESRRDQHCNSQHCWPPKARTRVTKARRGNCVCVCVSYQSVTKSADLQLATSVIATQSHRQQTFCKPWIFSGWSNRMNSLPPDNFQSHTRTVVRECFKGDEASQWKRPKFDPSPHQNPLTDLHKNWQAWFSPGRHPACKIL